MAELTPGEHVVVLLAEGRTLAAAATEARLDARDAFLEAQACGWPDKDAIKAAAADILRHAGRTPTDPTTPGDHMPRRATPSARRGARRDLGPLEPAVEAALSRGASSAKTAIGDLETPGVDEAALVREHAATQMGPGCSALATSVAARDAAADAILDAVSEPDDISAARRPDDPAIQAMPEFTDQQVLAKMHAENDAYLRMLSDREPAATPGTTAVLRLPLGRYTDADGTETVLGEALVHVRVSRDGVLDWISGMSDAAPAVVDRVEQRLTPDGHAAIAALALLLPQGSER